MSIYMRDKLSFYTILGVSFSMFQIEGFQQPRSGEAGNKTCPICFKIVTSHLRRHMWTHNRQEGPAYPCNVCGKLFRHRFTLYKHRRDVHYIEPYQCSKCTQGFPDLAALRAHESEHEYGTEESTGQHLPSSPGQIPSDQSTTTQDTPPKEEKP